MKKYLPFLLSLVMILSLCTGCSNDKENQNDESASKVEDEDFITGDGDEEIVTVEWWLPDFGQAGTSGSKASLVEDAINEWTEENINIHVNFTWVSFAEISTQATMAFSEGRTIDLLGTSFGAGGFPTYYSTGSCMDISEYLDEYGQDLLELFSEQDLLSAFTSADGGIYGVPEYRMLNNDLYFTYREDILEQAGVLDKFNNMTTWTEFEEVMAAIKEKTGIYPIGGAGAVALSGGYIMGDSDLIADSHAFDTLGDGMFVVYTDQEGNVSSFFENPAFVENCKRVAEWYEKGWVYPDSAFTSEVPENNILNGVFAGFMMYSEYGVEATKTQQFGTQAACKFITNGLLNTTSIQSFSWFVPVTSAEPAAAVKLLNAFYTTPELMDLITWGVEGETYVVEDGQASFPEGTDTSNCGYHFNDFQFGNQFITTPWVGTSDGVLYREKSLENFKSAETSIYAGLNVDLTEMATIQSALTAVSNEYIKQLSCGIYTDELYEECISKLKAAGLDEYLAYYQEAVDEFLNK